MRKLKEFVVHYNTRTRVRVALCLRSIMKEWSSSQKDYRHSVHTARTHRAWSGSPHYITLHFGVAQNQVTLQKSYHSLHIGASDSHAKNKGDSPVDI